MEPQTPGTSFAHPQRTPQRRTVLTIDVVGEQNDVVGNMHRRELRRLLRGGRGVDRQCLNDGLQVPAAARRPELQEIRMQELANPAWVRPHCWIQQQQLPPHYLGMVLLSKCEILVTHADTVPMMASCVQGCGV